MQSFIFVSQENNAFFYLTKMQSFTFSSQENNVFLIWQKCSYSILSLSSEVPYIFDLTIPSHWNSIFLKFLPSDF